ncbi:hypothetical protein NP493_235g00000 [Ridgeia piscesae]|uniref:Uncharacterized protein n=1 Tax=Ridgeia piscesae TaxID=27915 RepID=A0AAD9NZU3_RIDPI|nr:hypothetical protein NP493_235g00000 [Ridgeia piscesae]
MKAMLLSVIELRASDWGREPDDPSGGSTQTGNTLSNTSQVLEPMYNPVPPIDNYPEWYTGENEPLDGIIEMADGVFVYDDEDDDYEVDDAHGMDDEMTDAYELFMQQQQNKLQ